MTTDRTRTPSEPKPSLRARIHRFFTRGIWEPELGRVPRLRALGLGTVRVLSLATRGFVKDRCFFRASALTYITVLSVVPLLAFAFSVAKGFGAYDLFVDQTIQPFLDNTFGQSAPPEAEGTPSQDLRLAVDKVLSFVDETNVKSLGAIGLVLLLMTVLRLLGTIESSFNDIWGVERSRTFVRKVSDYLAMLVVAPILLLAAADLASTAVGEGFGQGEGGPEIGALALVIRLVLTWLAFAFVYLIFPNTRSRFSSAALGGVIGGSLWQVAQVLHVKFQVGIATYNSIYAGFAAFPIFLFWIYVSWVTVLVGAEFAAARQNLGLYASIARSGPIDHAQRESLAMRATARVVRAFLDGDPAPRSSELADQIGVEERDLAGVLRPLVRRGLLAEVVFDDLEPGFVPGRDPESVRVHELLDALRREHDSLALPARDPLDERVEEALRGLDEAAHDSAHDRTLRELATLPREPRVASEAERDELGERAAGSQPV